MDAQFQDYRVVEARNPAELAEAVRPLLLEGWVPAGGVAVNVFTVGPAAYSDELAAMYAQALVFPEEY